MFFVKLPTSDYETDIRSKLQETGGPGKGSNVGVFALKLCVFASILGAGNQNSTALATRSHSKGDC